MRSLFSARWLGYDPIPSNDKDFGLLIRRFIDVKKQSSWRQKERNTLFFLVDIALTFQTRHLFTTNLTIYRYRVARNYYLWKNIARWLYISIISSRTFQSTYQDRVRFNPPIINLIKASITWYIQEGVKEIVICEEGWSLFFF